MGKKPDVLVTGSEWVDMSTAAGMKWHQRKDGVFDLAVFDENEFTLLVFASPKDLVKSAKSVLDNWAKGVKDV